MEWESQYGNWLRASYPRSPNKKNRNGNGNGNRNVGREEPQERETSDENKDNHKLLLIYKKNSRREKSGQNAEKGKTSDDTLISMREKSVVKERGVGVT